METEGRQYYEGIGRRKTSSARVRIYLDGDASGDFVVNGKEVKEFFPRLGDYNTLIGPLSDAELLGKVDVSVLVQGGGITGQTDAVRLGIARALVKNPKLLLCDEPTGALDFETSLDVLKLLNKINDEYNTTILIITHNSAIKGMANRVMKIRSGKIVENYINDTLVDPERIEW